MLRPSMCKWVGNFSRVCFLVLFLASQQVFSEEREPSGAFDLPQLKKEELTWTDYDRMARQAEANDRINGISYIVSGAIALAGGIAGNEVTSDPVEKGIYALFQTIGIASIGYGAYKWRVGDDQRLLMTSLRNTRDMNDSQRAAFYRTYLSQKKEFEKRERLIRALTHGLIAGLNFYNGAQQKQEGVRNTLYFIGGANLLAAISFTF